MSNSPNRKNKAGASKTKSTSGGTATVNAAPPGGTLVILLCIALATVAILFAVHLSKAASDKGRFHWAVTRLNYAKGQLSSVTGLHVSSSWHNGCAPTSEQLFNNTQDCSTELFAEYTVTTKAQAIQAQTAIDNLMMSPQVFGNAFDKNATDTTFNIPSRGLNCYWMDGFTPDSSRIADGISTAVSFSATCTAPSATTIYP